MNAPSPSGSAGSARASAVGGSSRSTPAGENERRTAAETTAAPAPITAPPATSEAQCAPVCNREYPTPAATGASSAPAAGRSSPTAVAKATALAV